MSQAYNEYVLDVDTLRARAHRAPEIDRVLWFIGRHHEDMWLFVGNSHMLNFMTLIDICSEIDLGLVDALITFAGHSWNDMDGDFALYAASQHALIDSLSEAETEQLRAMTHDEIREKRADEEDRVRRSN